MKEKMWLVIQEGVRDKEYYDVMVAQILSLLKEEIKKVENPYSKAKLASAEYYEGEGFDKACQAILKILEGDAQG